MGFLVIHTGNQREPSFSIPTQLGSVSLGLELGTGSRCVQLDVLLSGYVGIGHHYLGEHRKIFGLIKYTLKSSL